MKKLIGITAIVAISLTLFSFSTTNVKKANYNEVKDIKLPKLLRVAGSFSSYENGSYTGDRGSWSTRRQTWSLTSDNGSLDAIDKTLTGL
jgi:hypothetical protein